MEIIRNFPKEIEIEWKIYIGDNDIFTKLQRGFIGSKRLWTSVLKDSIENLIFKNHPTLLKIFYIIVLI